MRNRYPGTCYRCGEYVIAGAGHFEKLPGPRNWRVQHAACAIFYRGTDVHYRTNPHPHGRPTPEEATRQSDYGDVI